MVLLAIAVIHVVIALSAARWWLRPLLLSFDKRLGIPHCKESDFFFFCWTWSLVLCLMVLWLVWDWTEHLWTRAFTAVSKKSPESPRNPLTG